MKKLGIFFCVVCLSLSMEAQDVMFLRSGDTLQVKLLEVGIAEIRYLKWSNLEGPLYVILKEEVKGIEYKNGTTDAFLLSPPPIEILESKGRNCLGNPREYYPVGLGGYILGPTGALSVELSYYLKPSFELNFGLGVGNGFGGYGGFRGHFWGGKEQKSTLYLGGIFSIGTTSFGFTRANVYIPLGLEFLSKGGFYFAPEIALLLDPFRSPIEDPTPFLGIRSGIRFIR